MCVCVGGPGGLSITFDDELLKEDLLIGHRGAEEPWKGYMHIYNRLLHFTNLQKIPKQSSNQITANVSFMQTDLRIRYYCWECATP